jgi:hypothetical protein
MSGEMGIGGMSTGLPNCSAKTIAFGKRKIGFRIGPHKKNRGSVSHPYRAAIEGGFVRSGEIYCGESLPGVLACLSSEMLLRTFTLSSIFSCRNRALARRRFTSVLEGSVFKIDR